MRLVLMEMRIQFKLDEPFEIGNQHISITSRIIKYCCIFFQSNHAQKVSLPQFANQPEPDANIWPRINNSSQQHM